MLLTKEQLEELESLAGLFFSVEDILIALDISSDEKDIFHYILLEENENPIFKAYHRGRLTQEIKLRQSIQQAALNGSNPAQNTLINFFNESSLK